MKLLFTIFNSVMVLGFIMHPPKVTGVPMTYTPPQPSIVLHGQLQQSYNPQATYNPQGGVYEN